MTPASCYHMKDATSYAGMLDRTGPLFACPFCIASKLRSNLSGSTPAQLAADLYLVECDESCVKTLVQLLLEQIDELKVGHGNFKRHEKALSPTAGIQYRAH